MGRCSCRGTALSLLLCGTRIFLTGGIIVSLIAFGTSSLAWLKATGTALGLVCLTPLTSAEPKPSVRLL